MRPGVHVGGDDIGVAGMPDVDDHRKEHSAAKPQPKKDEPRISRMTRIKTSQHGFLSIRVICVIRGQESSRKRRAPMDSSARDTEKVLGHGALCARSESFISARIFNHKEHKELKESQFYLCALCTAVRQSPSLSRGFLTAKSHTFSKVCLNRRTRREQRNPDSLLALFPPVQNRAMGCGCAALCSFVVQQHGSG